MLVFSTSFFRGTLSLLHHGCYSRQLLLLFELLQSLTLGPDPLPSEEDEDNGADFDVLPESDAHVEEDASLPSVPEKASSSDKKVNIMEAASSAEGGLELSPLPKAKKPAKALPSAALEALRPFLRVDPGAEDSDAVAPKPLPTDLGSLQSVLKRSSSRPPSKSRGRKGPDDHRRTDLSPGPRLSVSSPVGLCPRILSRLGIHLLCPGPRTLCQTICLRLLSRLIFCLGLCATFAEIGKKGPAHGSTCISIFTCSKKASTCVLILAAWPLPVSLPIRLCPSDTAVGNAICHSQMEAT